jgi:hypothetical protein
LIRDLRDRSLFDELALIAVSPVILTGTGETRRLEAARVSASLFPMLGVIAAPGRTMSRLLCNRV